MNQIDSLSFAKTLLYSIQHSELLEKIKCVILIKCAYWKKSY